MSEAEDRQGTQCSLRFAELPKVPPLLSQHLIVQHGRLPNTRLAVTSREWRYDVLTMATGVNLMSAGHLALGSGRLSKDSPAVSEANTFTPVVAVQRSARGAFQRDCETPSCHGPGADFRLHSARGQSCHTPCLRDQGRMLTLLFQADAGAPVLSFCPSAG